MVRLFCAIIGGGAAFSVRVEKAEWDDEDQYLVEDLREAIKAQSRGTITVPSTRLRLFLAKKDERWLKWAGLAAVALDGNECPKDFEEMNLTLAVKNPALFGEDFQPGQDEINVLVAVVPERKNAVGSVPLQPVSTDTHQDSIIQAETSRVKRITWTAPEACPRLAVDKNDPLIRLPWVCIDGAGIGCTVGKDLLLYRRAPFRKQWHEIDRCVIRSHARLWVVGPPGTGKSCAALAFAHTLNPSKWNVVWIHYTRSDGFFNCVRLMGGKKTACVVPLHELDRCNEVLESTTKAMARKTIVFLDGFTEPPHEGAAACSLCTWWRMRDEKHRRVVFVCSMRAPHDIFRIEDTRPIISDGSDFDDDDEAPSQRRGSSESEPAGNDDQDMEMNISGSDGDPIVKDQMLFSLESWRLEEYREAIGHEDFLRSVENVVSVTRDQKNPFLSEDDCKPAEGELGEEERGIQRAKWITKLLEEKYFVAAEVLG